MMIMVDLFRLNKHISKVNHSCRRVIVLHKFLLTLSCLSVSKWDLNRVLGNRSF